MLNDIYSNAEPNKRALFKEVFGNLSAGIVEGYGKNFPNIKYNTADFKMLTELNYNAGVFAVFKNHAQIKETVKLLKNEDGSLRSKKDFISEAQKLSDKYNKTYLATEYDQAVGSARMAKKWQDIERTKHLYPNIRYVAVIDDRTRQLHKQWHNIILPIEHPFWDTHYPPNDWGCRCMVQRTDKDIQDNGVDVNTIPALPKQFNMNVGKTGKVFNYDHPYFNTTNFSEVAELAKTALLRYQTTEIYATLKNTFKLPVSSQLGKVGINNKAIKEALNKPHKNGYFKNNLLYDLKAVLIDAFYIGSSEPFKEVGHWKTYHYLRVKDFEDMIVIIREDFKGQFFFYSITDKVKL
ncbi:phage minor head protein [Lutibacter sp.]|uniref:phage minor head protein n=1 Tax=Lutibacter sp. TaxID=1925666 RepID=UPI0035695844